MNIMNTDIPEVGSSPRFLWECVLPTDEEILEAVEALEK